MNKLLPRWIVFSRIVRTQLWLAIVISSFLYAPVATAQGFSAYSANLAFEERVERLNPACMPEPYDVVEQNYAYRVLEEIYDQCAPIHYSPDGRLYTKSNISAKQLDKFVTLAFASAADPTGFSIAFTAEELATEGLKCVFKTFVNASDQLSPMQKTDLDKTVDSAFTVRDWKGFIKGIPSIASQFDAQKAKALADTLLALYDRAPEGMSFAQSVGAAYDTGATALTEWHDGPRKTAWRKAQESFARCDYGEALSQMLVAKQTAEKECIKGGDAYRQAERNLRAYEAGGVSLDVDDMLVHSAKKRAVQTFVEKMTALMDFYDDFNKFEAGFQAAQKGFLERRADYKATVRRALRGSQPQESCYNLQYLADLIAPENLNPSCHAEFFKGERAAMPYPYELSRDMAQLNYQQLDEWWQSLNQITALHHQCDDAARDAAMQSLRADMAANPVVQWVAGECRTEDQSAITTKLDEMAYSVSPHCKMTEVPRAIDGAPLQKAAELLEEAQLFITGDPIRTEPQEGQTPNTVIDSDPAPGASALVWSGVQLTVVGPFPEVDLVTMPEVVGLEGGKAADLVRSVGLSAVVVAKEAADTPEKKPGYVYAATVAAGAKLPEGTLVSLSTYKERPLVAVPKVAKLSPENAGDVLRAAGFVAAGLSLGDPAPSADLVGKIYGSDPPYRSKHVMLTPVSPLIYGQVKITSISVPPLKDKTVQAASDLLAAYGDHFVVGALALSPDRPAGSILGQVHFSDPPAGASVPPGTVVTLFVYAPIEEEIGNLKLIPFEIIGMPADQAAGLLRGDDNFFAVPNPKDGDVAQNGQTPGTVQYAAPAAGTLALRGSAVQLFVYATPPLTALPPPVAEDRSGDSDPDIADDSWLGRWRISAPDEDAGGAMKFIGILEISQRGDGLWLNWITKKKSGELKSTLELPIRLESNVIRTRLDALDTQSSGGGGSSGVFAEEMSEMAIMFKQILETLKISRAGADCTVSVVDPKKGPQTMVFICERQRGNQ